jgi:hypothetical protein
VSTGLRAPKGIALLASLGKLCRIRTRAALVAVTAVVALTGCSSAGNVLGDVLAGGSASQGVTTGAALTLAPDQVEVTANTGDLISVPLPEGVKLHSADSSIVTVILAQDADYGSVQARSPGVTTLTLTRAGTPERTITVTVV